MTSKFIKNWKKDIQNKINFWFNNYLNNPSSFQISNSANTPMKNILSYHLTSCCKTSTESQISFDHFPEPYYGNPDDNILKSAVVLFFNPGEADDNQLLGNANTSCTFHARYNAANNNYYKLASKLNFCDNTIKKFWNIKLRQLNKILSEIIPNNDLGLPLFMDLIPWHSKEFKGLVESRFKNSYVIEEAKRMVFIPAFLNAINTKLNRYLHEDQNSVILMCVGAKYSRDNILSSLGFKDISDTINTINNPFPNLSPPNLRFTILNSNNDICVDSKSKLKIWKCQGKVFLDGIKIDNEASELLFKKDLIIINIWTIAKGMDIPSNIGSTIKSVLDGI